MLDALREAPPLAQAFGAGVFTWALTAAGAAMVFLRRRPGGRTLAVALGFAGGIMLAATYWSLLAPAIEHARGGALPAWLPAAVGFALGGLSIAGLDRVLPHLHPGNPPEMAEGVPSSWRRSTLLVSAITLHNVPEGLAVGVAFGAAAIGTPGASFETAAALAVGIALQNVPEGLAVALPLRAEGMPAWRCFLLGQASALVEPVAAVAGAGLLLLAQLLLPYALAFAAGAMVFVVVEELVPEFQAGGHADLGTLALLGGFILMMALDVGLSP